MKRWPAPCLLLALNVACATVRPVSVEPETPRLLSWSEQLAVREAWLVRRHELLLPMMRHHGVGMWIIVNEEFHDDPLTQYVAPPLPYAGPRDVFVFIDAGEQGLRKVALPSYREENLTRFFEVPEEKRESRQVLGELYNQYQPGTIALGIEGKRGVTHSLTRDAYAYLVEALGPEARARFISAAPLIEEYLDTRIPEELEHYRTLVGLTERVVKRAFSAEVVKPGLKRVLANTNALQDALVKASRPGRSSAEVYEAVMAEMKEKGIQAQVYSHPLGNQGHGLGASIDFRSTLRKEEPKRLREGSYLAMELSTRAPVAEWDGQEVFAMAEDPVFLTPEGWRFFVPRQETYYLIQGDEGRAVSP